jgi:hypothetical protein
MRLHAPPDGASRAATWGCDATLTVHLECVVGECWLWENAPRCPAPSSGAAGRPSAIATAPAPPRTITPGLEGADAGLRGWLREQARLRSGGAPAGSRGAGPSNKDSEAIAVAAHTLSVFLDLTIKHTPDPAAFIRGATSRRIVTHVRSYQCRVL